MNNKRVSFFVGIVGLIPSLAGCGGLGKRSECLDCTPPVVCPGDAYLSGGICVAFAPCSTGTYVLKPGTPTEDQTCEPCLSGSYSAQENSASCTPWSTCPAGTFAMSTPTDRNDRSCAPCPAGTMTTGPNQSMCTRPDQCHPGRVQTSAGTSTSAPVCAQCRAGEYCPGGTYPMQPCAGDKWDDDENPATACVPLTSCGPGTYAERVASPTVDNECSPCSPGTFTTAKNATSCQSWTTCKAGTYLVNAPSATTDRQCATCPAGSYTTGENQSACLTASDCPAGTFESSPGSSNSAPACTPCIEGEYCAGGSSSAKPCVNETWDHDGNPATQCVAWTLCRPGSYVASAGSTTADVVCAPCASGTFSAVADSPECAPWTNCPAGTFVGSLPTSGSDRICLECTSGSFSDTENSNTCEMATECPANITFASVPATHAADTVCTPCTKVGCTKYCDSGGTCLDCLTDDDCEAGTTCIDAMCTKVACTGGTIYFSDNFSGGNDQSWWTNEGDDSPWEIGPAVAWPPQTPYRDGTYSDPDNDHSPGDDNLMAGVVIGGIAPPQTTSSPHYFISPFIDLPAVDKIYLEYYHWLNSDSSYRMINAVEVFDGGQWVTLWSGPPTNAVIGENAWQRRVHDITAYANPSFALRFSYDVLSSPAQPVASWNLDDIRIASTPTCR